MSMMANWTFHEGEGNQTREEITGMKHQIHCVSNENNASRPIWREGLTGKALLFDGYSTWVECGPVFFEQEFTAFSIEAWVAPRVWTPDHGLRGAAIVNDHDRDKLEGFNLCMHRYGTVSFEFGTGSEWIQVSPPDAALPVHVWTHLAAVFDGGKGKADLYVNGQLAASKTILPKSKVPMGKNKLIIGRNNHPHYIIGPFTDHMFNGLVDAVRIYGTALTQEEIMGNYNGVAALFRGNQLPLPDTKMDRNRYEGDRHRPRFHFTAPEHWMNEPHAPFYYNGQYHLFYQHNPIGPYWGNIHWGHAVSKDLVQWRDLPVALSPGQEDVDPDGCWSGSAVIDDEGIPRLFYTAGDHSQSPGQLIASAGSTVREDQDNNLLTWKKSAGPVVVQQEGQGWFGNFRDPFLWKEEDTWYMLVGTGILGEGGTAMLYTSKYLHNWTYRSYFYIGNYAKYPKTGRMWELPVFLKIDRSGHGDKYILIINPWFGEPSEHYNKYMFYWLGTFDKEAFRFIPDDETPRTFVYGEHFTGPSGFIDQKGRAVIFSLIQDFRTEKQQYHAGWAHCAGLPVELKLGADNQLTVAPVEELQVLRKSKLVSVSDMTMEEANGHLKGIKENMLEIMLELQPQSAGKYGIKLCRTPDGEEETLIYYDRMKRELNVDKTKSSLDPDARKGIQGGIADLAEDGSLKLHIYLDHSVIEAYVNRRKLLATRVYPTRNDASGIQIWGDGSLHVKRLEIWSMCSFY